MRYTQHTPAQVTNKDTNRKKSVQITNDQTNPNGGGFRFARGNKSSSDDASRQ